MHLVYIDDSRDEELCAFSAIIVPADQWRESFEWLRSFRRSLKQSEGVFVRKELHAWKFVSGRGQISDRIVTKYRRYRRRASHQPRGGAQSQRPARARLRAPCRGRDLSRLLGGRPAGLLEAADSCLRLPRLPRAVHLRRKKPCPVNRTSGKDDTWRLACVGAHGVSLVLCIPASAGRAHRVRL